MRTQVEIIKNTNGLYFGIIKVKHNFIMSGDLRTELKSSKGQLKREIIQFCGKLNLEIEWIYNSLSTSCNQKECDRNHKGCK